MKQRMSEKERDAWREFVQAEGTKDGSKVTQSLWLAVAVLVAVLFIVVYWSVGAYAG